MSLKREHSVPSSDTTPARKVPRISPIHIPSSFPPVPAAPTVVSPSDTEHNPTPPNDVFVDPGEPVTQCHSLEGLGPAQLASRLEALTERYERGVDEVEAEVILLRRQVSVARRYLETSPSGDEGDDKSDSALLSIAHDTSPRRNGPSVDAAAHNANKRDKARADEEDERDVKSPRSRPGILEADVGSVEKGHRERESEDDEQYTKASRSSGMGETMHCRGGKGVA